LEGEGEAGKKEQDLSAAQKEGKSDQRVIREGTLKRRNSYALKGVRY